MELGDDPHIHGPIEPLPSGYTVADMGGISLDCRECEHPAHLPGECSEQKDGDDCTCQGDPPSTFRNSPTECHYRRQVYPKHDYYYGHDCRRCGHPQTVEEKLDDLIEGVWSGHLAESDAALRIHMWVNQFVPGGKLTDLGASKLIRDRLERAQGLKASAPEPLPVLSILETRVVDLLTDECKHLTGREIADILVNDGDPNTPLIMEVLLANLVKRGELVITYSVPEKK